MGRRHAGSSFRDRIGEPRQSLGKVRQPSLALWLKGKRLQAWVMKTGRDIIMGTGFRKKTSLILCLTYTHIFTLTAEGLGLLE